MPLSDIALRNAKPRESDYKISDGKGLYLLVRKNGSRSWNLAYRFDGRQKKLHIGPYPLVSLSEARNRRDAARGLLTQKIDPNAQKKIEAAGDAASTWEAVATEWVNRIEAQGAAGRTVGKKRWLLAFTYPSIGERQIRTLTAPEMLAVIRPLEARGLNESAIRLRGLASQVFRYAIVTGRAERDVCADLKGAIKPPRTTHHAALVDPEQVGGLMRAIRAYRGKGSAKFALRLLPLVFVRSAELRYATWQEIDEKGAIWRIPAERMKMSRDHVVPLSRQALAVLDDLRAAAYPAPFLFPSIRTAERPISENTINASLRRMGFDQSEMTGHGFRTMASTILNENGFASDWIERQLAHVEGNKVRRAYNAAEYLEGRATMMQWWADFLDRQAAGEEDLIG